MFWLFQFGHVTKKNFRLGLRNFSTSKMLIHYAAPWQGVLLVEIAKF